MSGPAAAPQSSDTLWSVPVVASGQGTLVHGSCVAAQGQGVLIVGPSGSGKSSLALRLMALGATLVSDDQTGLIRQGDCVHASAPAAISGMIEARGVGLLCAETTDAVEIGLVIDLGTLETDRLPAPRMASLLGMPLRLLHKADSLTFPAAILQYLKAGEVRVP